MGGEKRLRVKCDSETRKMKRWRARSRDGKTLLLGIDGLLRRRCA